MTAEMNKIINDMIREYEDTAIGEEMSEWEKKMFRDAFLKGVNFAENLGTYL